MKEAHILVTILVQCLNSLAHSDDNCQFQGDIYKLKNEGKCVSIEHGHSKQLQAQWEDCIEQLTKKLDAKCLGLGLKKVQRYFIFHFISGYFIHFALDILLSISRFKYTMPLMRENQDLRMI